MVRQAVSWDYQWGQIVGRAWADDDFKQRLFADPATVLQEYDLESSASRVELLEDPDQVPESTDDVLYLVLPPKPSDEELSEDELCSVGTGTAKRCGCGCAWCHGCWHCHCAWCGCHHPPKPDEN